MTIPAHHRRARRSTPPGNPPAGTSADQPTDCPQWPTRPAGDDPASGQDSLDTSDRCRHCGQLVVPARWDPRQWMHRVQPPGAPVQHYDRCGALDRPGAATHAEPVVGHRLHGGTVIAARAGATRDLIVLVFAPAVVEDRYVTAYWQPGQLEWCWGRYFRDDFVAAAADWNTR